MALKDWKKVSKDMWKTNKGNLFIVICRNIYGCGTFKNYGVELRDNDSYFNSKITINGEFKTRLQALKFAEQYMRTQKKWH